MTQIKTALDPQAPKGDPNKPKAIGNVSFWYADQPLPLPRPSLSASISADICIIGAGYTGLWTALYIKEARPDLRVVIVEKSFAGFGASGRNGGWLTGGFAWNHHRYAQTHGVEATRAMVHAMGETVPEIITRAKLMGIEADILPTDELIVARNSAQYARLTAEAVHRRSWGEEDRIRLIGGDELAQRVFIPNALGAMVVEGVARIQPAKLVRGLARAVEAAGVTIYEDTEVLHYSSGLVVTAQGHVSAPVILRATEGFTAALPGLKRDMLPLNSAQIVTAPLSDAIWAQIGWQGHEIIGDIANDYCYCQRTNDGRITMGARGTPYKFGSAIDDQGRPDQATIDRLVKLLHHHFPATQGQAIDHAWCGVLGVPRDWCATIGFDRTTGLGHAGGYVGVGVSTSNLAARSLRDLVLGLNTDLIDLPWINRPLRKWEPEPLRYLGVNAMYGLMRQADRQEAKAGRVEPSKLAQLGMKLMGRA